MNNKPIIFSRRKPYLGKDMKKREEDRLYREAAKELEEYLQSVRKNLKSGESVALSCADISDATYLKEDFVKEILKSNGYDPNEITILPNQ